MAVVSAVDIDAPPETVWRNVITFPPLAEPDDWVFRAGVAYPVRADIEGRGPGAVRYCVFSTGPFVEPIEVWGEPELLRFRVEDQPEPMREWSPYAIHPPHLHGFLVSHRGQFKLTPLPGGRTRLEGTTWYTNRMWPAGYWQLWSDAIIRRTPAGAASHPGRVRGSRGIRMANDERSFARSEKRCQRTSRPAPRSLLGLRDEILPSMTGDAIVQDLKPHRARRTSWTADSARPLWR